MRITMEQMETLLRKAQEIQVKDGGKSDMLISTHSSEDGRLWFVININSGEEWESTYVSEWRTYEECVAIMNEFEERWRQITRVDAF